MRSEDDEPFHGFVDNNSSNRPVNDRQAALRRGRRVSASRSRERLLRRRSRSVSVDSNRSLEWDHGRSRDSPIHVSLRDARAAAREAARDSRRLVNNDVRTSPRRSPPISDRQPAAGAERQGQPDGEDEQLNVHGGQGADADGADGGAVPRRGQISVNPNNVWPPPAAENGGESSSHQSRDPPAAATARPPRGAEALPPTSSAQHDEQGGRNTDDVTSAFANMQIPSTPITEEDHHLLLLTAEMNFEDEIENCSARQLPTDVIREKVDIANSIKEMINEAEIFLMRQRNVEFMRDRRKWKRIKVATLAFRNQCYSELHNRESNTSESSNNVDADGRTRQEIPPPPVEPRVPQPTAAETAAQAESQVLLQTKKNKLRLFGPDCIDDLANIMDEINNFLDSDISTDAEFKNHDERHQTLMKRAGMLEKEAVELSKIALDIGLGDDHLRFERRLRTLRKQMAQMITKISEAKIHLGFAQSSGSSLLRSLDISPPTFRGDADEVDFFTFKQAFLDYLSIKPGSSRDSVLLIKNQCLKGSAKQACQHLETMPRIWDMLERLYGNPRELIAGKLREIVAAGKCPSDPARGKEWCIKIKSELTNTKRMADNFQLSNLVTMSPMIYQIPDMMPSLQRNEFECYMIDNYDRPNDIVHYDELIKFLDKLTRRFSSSLEKRSTLEIMNASVRGAHEARENRNAKKEFKNSKSYACASTNPNSTLFRNDTDSDSDASLTAEWDPQITSAERAIYQVKFVEPKSVACKFCEKKHEFLFECKKKSHGRSCHVSDMEAISLERKFIGAKVHRSESSKVRKCIGAKFIRSESS